MVKYLALLIISLMFFSCNRKELHAIDFVHWVDNEGNGLKVKKSIGQYEFMLQYKPLEYIILKNLRKLNLSEDEFQTEKEQIKDMQYYSLCISSVKGQGDILKHGLGYQQEYQDRLMYFSSRMQDDLFLLDGKDSLKCLIFHYERNYGVSPVSTFLLAFERKENGNKEENKVLVYNDNALNSGIVKLTILGEDIKNLPKLKLEANVN